MVKTVFIAVILIAATQSLSSIEGKVTAIVDGNTMDVTTADGEVYRIVLLGIDCPELKQEYGTHARDFLEEMALNAEVIVHLHGKDRQKNYLGVVVIDELGDVRLPMLQEGFAWTSEKDPAAELEAIRIDAMKRKAGLWKDELPVAPWIFRREQSMLEAKSR